VPEWLLDDSPGVKAPISKQTLDELAAGVQSGILDTAIWQDLVHRFGEKEAARILKVAVFSRHAVQSEPNN
jgi:hypothetical protein